MAKFRKITDRQGVIKTLKEEIENIDRQMHTLTKDLVQQKRKLMVSLRKVESPRFILVTTNYIDNYLTWHMETKGDAAPLIRKLIEDWMIKDKAYTSYLLEQARQIQQESSAQDEKNKDNGKS